MPHKLPIRNMPIGISPVGGYRRRVLRTTTRQDQTPGLLNDHPEDCMAGYSPTLRARRLRTELRRLRVAAGLSVDEAAARLEWSSSTLSRIELGHVGISADKVQWMLHQYEVTDPNVVDPLLQLAREARRRGWWYTYRDVMPGWFQLYLDFEAGASLIQTYESELVPGLLQTEDYARAAITKALPDAEQQEIDRRVAARMQRQTRLAENKRPRLHAVLNEGAVRRVIGGAETTRKQQQHLLEMGKLPNITIQVVEFAAGAHSAMAASFTILTFPEPTDPDITYIEYRTGALYVEDPDEVVAHQRAYDDLRTEALNPDKSAELISRLAAQ